MPAFQKETARTFIESFEKYLNDNKDSVEALRIIYNSENVVITHDMLCDLRDKLISENRLFTPYYIWNNYKILDVDGNVEQLDAKQNVNALTHLIQLVRYAFRKKSNSFEPVYRIFSAFQLILRSNAAVSDG